MDIKVHDQILWRGCLEACESRGLVKDPRVYFPLMSRGSWMNDTNQATLFTDQLEKLSNDAVNDDLQLFFRAYYNEEQKALLEKMSGEPEQASAVVADAKDELKEIPSGATDDFGAYNRLDHLDVVDDDSSKELPNGEQQVPLGLTIAQSMYHVKNRLNSAATLAPPDRFGWAQMTTFGKALHTVADFWAHSNYVELMLWSLAWRGLMDKGLVREFNAPTDFLCMPPYETCYCPLPPERPNGEVARRNVMFWYESSPETTPLVSTLFDTSDTAVSLHSHGTPS